ncbi:hypothetical protein [Rhizobium sp. 18065]|uniref:hypothetical protein n=1 Tax=Rhizobium sp. 18065 TaxID=2681411 RepID=UPI0013582DFC|nr:hypothetical protein [Rhizobium sp. 18065]
MGFNLYAKREWKDDPENDRSVEIASRDGPWRQTKVEIEPSAYAGRPNEVILHCEEVNLRGSHNLDFLPTELRLRIHGRTVVELMDALIEDPATRRYLASGVDFFREKEAKKKAASEEMVKVTMLTGRHWLPFP